MRTSLLTGLVVSLIIMIGCSFSGPTAPTNTGATPFAADLASTGGRFVAHSLLACEEYDRQFRGICQAARALECESPETQHGPQCGRLRVYVSHDPIKRASIRWSCPTGFESFSDDSGCGCRLPNP